MKTPLIYKFLDDDELLRISNKIKEEEKKTAGEICVSIKENRSFLQRKKSVRKIAEEEFFKLGIDKTRDKTGILIFFLLEAREFQILADSGINEKVPENTWDGIKDEMQLHFLEGRFSEGIIHGVTQVGKILSEYFPVKSDDTDELSNKVVLE
jgi:uncharacterized membrane protein